MLGTLTSNPFRKAGAPALATAFLFVLATCRPPVDVPPDGPPGVASFSCETGCGPAESRSSRLILEWENPRGEELLLEATTYKSGFDRGLFNTVDLSTPQPNMDQQSDSEQSDPAPIGGLLLERPSESGYRLILTEVDPGSRYFFRLRFPDESRPPTKIDCVAQVCPMDFVEPQEDSR